MPFDNPLTRVEIPLKYGRERQFLDEVAAVIPTPDRWCKRRETSKCGNQHCIAGAISVVHVRAMTGAAAGDYEELHAEIKAYCNVVNRLNELAPHENMIRYNDGLFTTHKGVMRLIKAARASFG